MNRRRSVHFRGATWPSHRRGMGMDTHSAAMNGPAIRRRLTDGHLWFSILKKTLHWWRGISSPLRSVSSNPHSDIAFSWKFVLFHIHIALLSEDIYVHHGCSERIIIVLLGYITNLLTLKLRGFHSNSNRRPFALQLYLLTITPSDPEAFSYIFYYILAFSLISTLN